MYLSLRSSKKMILPSGLTVTEDASQDNERIYECHPPQGLSKARRVRTAYFEFSTFNPQEQ
jgi:hypothetical protein